MSVWNVHVAKAHLSDLLARVERGEEVVIARAGVPAARIVRYTTPDPTRREPGSARDEFTVPDDFNDPLPPEMLGGFQ